MADTAGDRLLKFKTFVLSYGRKNTFWAVAILILLSCTLTIAFALANYYYLVAFVFYGSVYVFSFAALVVNNNSNSQFENFVYKVEFGYRTLIFSILLFLTSPRLVGS